MQGIMFDFKMHKVLMRKMNVGSKYQLLKFSDEWPIPAIETPNQVLVRTRMGGICKSDLSQIGMKIPYYASILASKKNPLTLGHEVVGEVDRVGSSVTALVPGDRVILNPAPSCIDYGFEPCPSCRSGNVQNCYSIAGVGDGSELEKLYKEKRMLGGLVAGVFLNTLPLLKTSSTRSPAVSPMK